jgi:hypothetical protein
MEFSILHRLNGLRIESGLRFDDYLANTVYRLQGITKANSSNRKDIKNALINLYRYNYLTEPPVYKFGAGTKLMLNPKTNNYSKKSGVLIPFAHYIKIYKTHGHLAGRMLFIVQVKDFDNMSMDELSKITNEPIVEVERVLKLITEEIKDEEKRNE